MRRKAAQVKGDYGYCITVVKMEEDDWDERFCKVKKVGIGPQAWIYK